MLSIINKQIVLWEERLKFRENALDAAKKYLACVLKLVELFKKHFNEEAIYQHRSSSRLGELTQKIIDAKNNINPAQADIDFHVDRRLNCLNKLEALKEKYIQISGILNRFLLEKKQRC